MVSVSAPSSLQWYYDMLASEAITTYSPAVGSQEGAGQRNSPVIGFRPSSSVMAGRHGVFDPGERHHNLFFFDCLGSVSDSRGHLSYVQYNGANKGTVEKSNIAYGVVTSQTTTSTGCTGSSTIICTSYPPAFGMDVDPLYGVSTRKASGSFR